MAEAFATANLGRLAARTLRFDEAQSLLERAAGQLHAIGAEGLALEVEARRAEAFVFEGRHREAAETAEKALARATDLQRSAPLTPLLERTLGYAFLQEREPASAKRHFEASLEAARESQSKYELALTLRAVAETEGDVDSAETILQGLGVVDTPRVPLP